MKEDILYIDRSKWKTGSSGHGYSRLLNQEGFMCCLGFRCEQMGIPTQELLEQACPSSLGEVYDIPDLITEEGYDTSFSNEAMSINDKSSIRSSTRERLIKKHFATIGIKVVYRGKY